ncbi:MAG: CocE/NonD family hydrolase [Saprospiraceae bacterium]|nr:CocE/NonD family hydrolase [Saprospiraceae bacterium]
MKNISSALFPLIFLLLIPTFASPQDTIIQKLKEVAIIDQKLMIPMRDGVRLCTDVYRPLTDEPVPIIFSKTPYNFNMYQEGEFRSRTLERALEAVEQGYAYIVQNERGQFFSEGLWDILGPPITDGYDALTWMADQSWSNGKVGTFGCSSTAEWQMGLASLNHPAHAAMVPQGFGAGVGRVGEFYEQGNWYRGGAQQMLFTAWLYGRGDRFRPTFPVDMTQADRIRVARYFDLGPDMPGVDWSEALSHLPVIDIFKNVNGPANIYEKMMMRKPNDPAWYEGGLYHDDMPFGVPSLWFASWYDVSTGPNLALFNHVRTHANDPEVRENQYLFIAPTLHCRYNRATENTVVGERNVGDATYEYKSLIYGWFNYWLKGKDELPITNIPRVQYYLMGKNVWKTASAWPPPEAEIVTYYLQGKGHANSRFGDGRLETYPPVEHHINGFSYDPLTPVPSHGGNVCCTGNAVEGGSFDQQNMESRNDILVYTSEPMVEGIEITGTIDITLFVSSDVKDTDFTVKLIDVYPDGRAYNLDETIQRVRYREGYDKEVFMQPGQVYELHVSPMSTSNYFKKGHRIRIEVSSSNFPRFERNMNTGGNNWDESTGVVAHNQVHHSPSYRSHIRLPVIKNSTMAESKK